jgi:hypothetical protein
MTPTEVQASQFAIMIAAGLPAADALRYFLPEEAVVDTTTLAEMARRWQRNRLVGEATSRLQGGDWTSLSKEQRIQLALDKHRGEMAYLLYSHNFADEMNPAVLNKMNTARQSLEAFLAGNAGKHDPFADFMRDLASGKVGKGAAKEQPPRIGLA